MYIIFFFPPRAGSPPPNKGHASTPQRLSSHWASHFVIVLDIIVPGGSRLRQSGSGDQVTWFHSGGQNADHLIAVDPEYPLYPFVHTTRSTPNNRKLYTVVNDVAPRPRISHSVAMFIRIGVVLERNLDYRNWIICISRILTNVYRKTSSYKRQNLRGGFGSANGKYISSDKSKI